MTVLAIPYLAGEPDLRRCLESIDIDARLVVIDNSDDGLPDAYDEEFCAVPLPKRPFVIELPHNAGVAASWNLAIKSYPHEPFWIIANHDTVLAPGDLQRLIDEMAKPGPRWVGMNGDWRVFGINAECIETVGLFDENFVPIYCEDADYEYRCTLAGVPWYHIEGGATHVGSATIRDPRYADANARTYPANRAYYRDKWGGDLRGGEVFRTPFDRGGHVGDWRLDLSRLRANDWCPPDGGAGPAG